MTKIPTVYRGIMFLLLLPLILVGILLAWFILTQVAILFSIDISRPVPTKTIPTRDPVAFTPPPDIIAPITLPTTTKETSEAIAPPQYAAAVTIDPTTDYTYITVIDSCNYDFTGTCVAVRSGPGLDFPVVSQLRNAMVLLIDPSATVDADGHLWYKIIFDEWLRYPNRIAKEWYVASDYVQTMTGRGIETISSTTPTSTTKRIVVDRSNQTLIAYDGDTIFMETTISTGLALTPTPRGTFSIYQKTPTRYMQGPLPDVSTQYYDLPGVPWNLYFTKQGAVIHGAYWHNSFGKTYSHGCVNLKPIEAQLLYHWATLATTVVIQE